MYCPIQKAILYCTHNIVNTTPSSKLPTIREQSLLETFLFYSIIFYYNFLYHILHYGYSM